MATFNDIVDKAYLKDNIDNYDTAKIEPIRDVTNNVKKASITLESGRTGWITLAKTVSNKDVTGVVPVLVSIESITSGNARACVTFIAQADLRNGKIAVLGFTTWAYQFTDLVLRYDGSNPYDYYLGIYLGRNSAGFQMNVTITELTNNVEGYGTSAGKIGAWEPVCTLSTPPGTNGAIVNLETYRNTGIQSSAGFADSGTLESSLYALKVRNIISEPARVSQSTFATNGTVAENWVDIAYIKIKEGGTATLLLNTSRTAGETTSMVLSLTKPSSSTPSVDLVSFSGTADSSDSRSIGKIKICTVDNPTDTSAYVIKVCSLQKGIQVRATLIENIISTATVSSATVNISGGWTLYTASSNVGAPNTLAEKELDYDTYYNKGSSIKVLGEGGGGGGDTITLATETIDWKTIIG